MFSNPHIFQTTEGNLIKSEEICLYAINNSDIDRNIIISGALVNSSVQSSKSVY